MADQIDRAQERELLDRELAIQQQTRPRPIGLAACQECDEPISDARRGNGARRCVPCQADAEAEAKKRTARVAI